jgi:hypothetical protein
MACPGKIARLPNELRARLNSRLQDGADGPRLLLWLNGLPQVRAILARDFHARPVTQQNLSNWRLGGYQEWLAHQDILEMAVQLANRGHPLPAAASGQPPNCAQLYCNPAESRLPAKIFSRRGAEAQRKP